MDLLQTKIMDRFSKSLCLNTSTVNNIFYKKSAHSADGNMLGSILEQCIGVLSIVGSNTDSKYNLKKPRRF